MTVRISVSKKERSTTLTSVLVIVVIFAAAAAGVYLGMSLKGNNAGPRPVEAAQDPNSPTTQLVSGTQFPDVTVFDESGTQQSFTRLLDGKGGVILFMELGCPPCKEMSLKWQDAIDKGVANGIPVLGVTVNLPVNIRPYRLKNKLSFPIYSDTLNIFMDKYDVTNYPLEVVVGKSGKVTYTTFNSAEPIDFGKLRKQLEG